MGRLVNARGVRLGVSTNWINNFYGKENINHNIKEINELITFELKKENNIIGIIQHSYKINEWKIIVPYSNELNKICNINNKNILKLLYKTNLLKKGIKINIIYNLIPWKNFDATLLNKWIALKIECDTEISKIKKEVQDWLSTSTYYKSLKLEFKGRLEGIEEANKAKLNIGKISLQTLNSNIDYNETRCYTIYGVIGLKLWLMKKI